jgi:hypothetical protein
MIRVDAGPSGSCMPVKGVFVQLVLQRHMGTEHKRLDRRMLIVADGEALLRSTTATL